MSIKHFVTARVLHRNLSLQIEHIVRRGRELFWQLPLFETHYSDLVTNFDIGVAGAIYAERRRSRLGLNEIWCMCRPAEFLQR
jgi:hypothetical protein